MKLYNWKKLNPKEQIELLKRPALSNDLLLQERISEIIEVVKDEGDRALISLTKELDSVSLSNILVSPDEIRRAEKLLSKTDKCAIEEAKANITQFHRAQLPEPLAVETTPGVYC